MFADGLKNHHSEPKFSALLQFCKWLTIAGNFQTFLTLLTTQLKNQDPTSPPSSSWNSPRSSSSSSPTPNSQPWYRAADRPSDPGAELCRREGHGQRQQCPAGGR